MANTKHTPGPWRVDTDDDDLPIIGHPAWKCRRHGVAGEWEIAKVEDLFEEHEEERLANAYLIAAAPSMLEAMIDAARFLKHGFADEARETLIAAIEKAEGRS